jgi:hypothetical protein
MGCEGSARRQSANRPADQQHWSWRIRYSSSRAGRIAVTEHITGPSASACCTRACGRRKDHADPAWLLVAARAEGSTTTPQVRPGMAPGLTYGRDVLSGRWAICRPWRCCTRFAASRLTRRAAPHTGRADDGLVHQRQSSIGQARGLGPISAVGPGRGCEGGGKRSRRQPGGPEGGYRRGGWSGVSLSRTSRQVVRMDY